MQQGETESSTCTIDSAMAIEELSSFAPFLNMLFVPTPASDSSVAGVPFDGRRSPFWFQTNGFPTTPCNVQCSPAYQIPRTSAYHTMNGSVFRHTSNVAHQLVVSENKRNECEVASPFPQAASKWLDVRPPVPCSPCLINLASKRRNQCAIMRQTNGSEGKDGIVLRKELVAKTNAMEASKYSSIASLENTSRPWGYHKRIGPSRESPTLASITHAYRPFGNQPRALPSRHARMLTSVEKALRHASFDQWKPTRDARYPASAKEMNCPSGDQLKTAPSLPTDMPTSTEKANYALCDQRQRTSLQGNVRLGSVEKNAHLFNKQAKTTPSPGNGDLKVFPSFHDITDMTGRRRADVIRWYQCYRDLLAYKEKFGNLDVPQRYKPNPRLGNWVNKHRMTRAKLPHWKVLALDAVGFNWGKRREDAWGIMYQELVAFKKLFGSCHVPTKFEENLKLGRWVSRQRNQYRLMRQNDGKSTMNTEKMRLLKEIGFVWIA